MYQKNKEKSLFFWTFSAWPLPTFEKCQMKLCTKLCTNFIFSVFSGTFLRAKNKKIRTRKVRKKLDNKGKTGDFSSPVFLV